jgi:glycosyltransferase involved in cell wall biosynthesis
MNLSISLSYVMTTFNKLAYLQVTLPYLLEACQQDEEIVIVDGGSTDGTAEFLKDLYQAGKIHQFLSEKDFGEAHGTNKAMLLARGTLIKIVTDDDMFSFSEINHCKQFMLENLKIDVLGFDGFGLNMVGRTVNYSRTNFMPGFKQWRINRKPFLFCGLSLIIRKSSIPYLGLFNPSFKIVDMEYSMRISALPANIAFYTGLAFVNIVGAASNSVKFNGLIERERKRVNSMYLNKRSSLSGAVANLKMLMVSVKHTIVKPKKTDNSQKYAEFAKQSLLIMKEHNAAHQNEFLMCTE